MREQYDTLERNADSVSRQVQYILGSSSNRQSNITAVSAISGEAIGGYVFVTDLEGRIITSNLADASSNGRKLPEWMVNTAASGRFNSISNIDGILNTGCYVSSSRIEDNTGGLVGFVFTGVPTSRLAKIILKFVIIYVLVSLIIMPMVIAGAYAVAAQMVRPLREMSRAAKRMSMGDYSTKFKVTRGDEIGELEEAFNEMAESVSRTEQSRRGFIANVSHELKTPLTTISGFIDGILDGTVDAENEKKYLSIVSGEVKRMNALVMSMFNLSKLESGAMKPDFKQIDPSKTIVAVILSFEDRINSKNIDVQGLDTLSALTVSADEGLFHQAVYNLVDNAVKFTPVGGEISVSCEKAEDTAVIKIRNSGEGIPANELSKIFERFYKTDTSRGMDKNGAGLGLSLVKTVIDLHSGSITVRSLEGQYTEFELRFALVEDKITAEKPIEKKRLKNAEVYDKNKH